MGNMPDLDYLVVAPHPDDAELCVGGTMLRLKAEGAAVGVLDLTDGEPTPHGTPELRQQESAAATAVLALDWRGNLGLQNRVLPPSLYARGLLAGLLRELRPRVLLAPYWEDAHPDHVAASELVDAARIARRAALPAAHPLLLFVPLEASRAAVGRGRCVAVPRGEDAGAGVLPLAIRRRSADRAADFPRRRPHARSALGLDHRHRPRRAAVQSRAARFARLAGFDVNDGGLSPPIAAGRGG
jgi:LmbE family N-acetylglucosaminyl deacetylase